MDGSGDAGRFGFLVGLWIANRTIVDLRTGSTASFCGTVRITPSNFVEQGQIRIAGTMLDSSRQYRLMSSDDGGLDIRFPDGRPFIRLAHHRSQRVFHLCGEDAYQGRFEMRSADRWAESWSVSGPRKRYRSFTRYRRSCAETTEAAIAQGQRLFSVKSSR